MIVKCDNCQTQYQVDDSKIPATGMAVKCSKCHNLFVVRPEILEPQAIEAVDVSEVSPVEPEPEVRPEVAAKSPEPEPEPYYSLRRPDGKTFSFRELATLQRWIVERRALQDDELSQNGSSWTRLDEIPDFAPFFQLVERATGTFETQPEPEPEPAPEPAPDPQPEPEIQAPAHELAAELQPELQPEPEPELEPEIQVTAGNETEKEAAQPKMTMQMWAMPEEETPQNPEISSPKPDSAPEPAPEPEPKPEPAPEPAPQPEPEPEPQPEPEPELEPVAEPEPRFEAASKQEEDEGFDFKASPQPDQGPSEWDELPVQSAKRDSWDENTDWDALADDDSEFAPGGRAKKAVLIGLAVIIAAAIVYVALNPALLRQVLPLGPSKETLAHLQDARISLNLNTPDSLADAEQALNKLVEQDAELYPALAMLAEVHTSRADLLAVKVTGAEKTQGNLDKKLKELSKQLEEKEDAELRKQAETLQQQLQRANQQVQTFSSEISSELQRAFSFGERAHQLAPDSLEANRALADYYRLGMDATKANDYLERAEKNAADDPICLYIKGAMFATDDSLLANALQSFKLAIIGDPTLIKAKFQLALLYLNQNKPEEARPILEEILQQNPQHLASQEQLDRLNELEKAKQAEEKAQEEKAAAEKPKAQPKATPRAPAEPAAPASYEQLMNKADRLRNSDRAKAALSLYQKAAEQKKTAEVYSGIGFCHFDMQNYKAALSNFKKAMSAQRNHQGAIIGMAMCYDQLSNTDQAIKYYERYLKLFPSGMDAAAAKGALGRLGK